MLDAFNNCHAGFVTWKLSHKYFWSFLPQVTMSTWTWGAETVAWHVTRVKTRAMLRRGAGTRAATCTAPHWHTRHVTRSHQTQYLRKSGIRGKKNEILNYRWNSIFKVWTYYELGRQEGDSGGGGDPRELQLLGGPGPGLVSAPLVHSPPPGPGLDRGEDQTLGGEHRQDDRRLCGHPPGLRHNDQSWKSWKLCLFWMRYKDVSI